MKLLKVILYEIKQTHRLHLFRELRSCRFEIYLTRESSFDVCNQFPFPFQNHILSMMSKVPQTKVTSPVELLNDIEIEHSCEVGVVR